MPRLIDLTGQPFGRLTVKGRGSNAKNGKARWWCECDCGGETLSGGVDLRLGKSTNCGCERLERSADRFRSHGQASSVTYRRWIDMKQRIRREPYYADLSIDPRWDSYENFQEDMDECPKGYSLERINNKLGYSPENCKWIPKGAQSRNTSRTRWITYDNRTMIAADWAREVGMPGPRLIGRLKHGWPIPQALGFEPRTRP